MGDAARSDAAAVAAAGSALTIAAHRWQDAESRLYPLIMGDPDLFQSAVTLVSEASAILRDECPSVDVLLAAEPDPVLARCPTCAQVRDAEFDVRIAFDAARAHRLRELTGPVGDRLHDL